MSTRCCGGIKPRLLVELGLVKDLQNCCSWNSDEDVCAVSNRVWPRIQMTLCAAAHSATRRFFSNRFAATNKADNKISR
jgi:hypothetical protein